AILPTFVLAAITPLAHASPLGPATWAIAAPAAGPNAAPTADASSPTTISATGSCTSASARNSAAATSSQPIITARRGSRSPSQPPIGASTLLAPIVNSSDSDSHAGEPGCAYSAKPTATPLASVPNIESRRATASRRTAARVADPRPWPGRSTRTLLRCWSEPRGTHGGHVAASRSDGQVPDDLRTRTGASLRESGHGGG